MLVCKLEDDFIGGILRKNIAQECHVVAELFEQIAQIFGHVVIEQEFHSLIMRHLTGNEQVDLSTVVFVVGKTLVNLSACELWEGFRRQRVHAFTILEQSNHIVDTNSGALDYRIAAPQPR